MVQAWFQAPPRMYLAIQAFLQFSFFVSQWEEYYTGVLPHATGHIGVTEVNYGLAIMSLLNAFFDHELIYSMSLSESLYDYVPGRVVDLFIVPFLHYVEIRQLRDLLALGWYCMMTVLVILSVIRVLKHVVPRQRFPAILKLATPFLVFYAALQLIPDEILQRELRIISLGIGLTTCLITIKLIVFSMARQTYGVFQWDALPLLVAIACTCDLNWTPLGMTRLWQWICVWFVFRIIQWNHAAIQQICHRMGIQLFVIKTKQV
jgi:hypothetical protein